jgi:lysophospholipase L1-like esterase
MKTVRRYWVLAFFNFQVIASPTGPIYRIACMGDSITEQVGSSNGVFYNHRGYWSHAAALLRQQVELVSNGSYLYFATGGKNSLYIQSVHLPQVLNSRADTCVILVGTNDYPAGRTPVVVAQTLREICESLIGSGITPVLCDILPLPSGQAAKSAWVASLNAEVAAVCAANSGIVHCDWAGALDSNGDGVADSDDYFYDQVHPDADGMTRLGRYLAAVLAPRVNTRDIFSDVTWVTPNPTMTGSGPTPDGWAIDAGTGRSISQSLIARGGGLGNWWQLSISGTDAGSYSNVRYGYGTLAGGWAVGDWVEFIVEFETDADVSPIWLTTPIASLQPSNTERRDFRAEPGTFTSFPRMESGILRTPMMRIPEGTTSVWPRLQVNNTGTVRFGRMGFRKVVVGYESWTGGFPGLPDTGYDADPDGDGIVNLMEYVLGRDPAVRNSESVSAVEIENGMMLFSFERSDLSESDVNLFLQTSDDLVTWFDSPIGPHHALLSGGGIRSLTMDRAWTVLPRLFPLRVISGGLSG